jgi:hypothetical protein
MIFEGKEAASIDLKHQKKMILELKVHGPMDDVSGLKVLPPFLPNPPLSRREREGGGGGIQSCFAEIVTCLCVVIFVVEPTNKGLEGWGNDCRGLTATDLTPMSLGLSHSLSRYKLKFSPDKVKL